MGMKAFIKGTDLELEGFKVGKNGKNVFFGDKYRHASGAKVRTAIPAELVEVREEWTYPATELPGASAS